MEERERESQEDRWLLRVEMGESAEKAKHTFQEDPSRSPTHLLLLSSLDHIIAFITHSTSSKCDSHCTASKQPQQQHTAMSYLLAMLCPCLGPRSGSGGPSSTRGGDDERAPLLGSASGSGLGRDGSSQAKAGSSSISGERGAGEERGFRRIERVEISDEALSNVRLHVERNLFHIDSSALQTAVQLPSSSTSTATASVSPARTSSLGPLGRRTRRSASGKVKSVQLGWEPRLARPQQREEQGTAVAAQEEEGEGDRRGRSTTAKLPVHSAAARLQESSSATSRVPSEHSLRTLYDEGVSRCAAS